MDPRQAARPGAAHQPEQKRLGLIVARVAERDDVRVALAARMFEELVSSAPCGVFDRSSFALRPGRHVPASGDERNRE